MQDAMFNSMPGLHPLDASTALLHGHRQMLQQANCFWQRITELVDIIKKNFLKDFGVCVRTRESGYSCCSAGGESALSFRSVAAED